MTGSILTFSVDDVAFITKKSAFVSAWVKSKTYTPGMSDESSSDGLVSFETVAAPWSKEIYAVMFSRVACFFCLVVSIPCPNGYVLTCYVLKDQT